VYIRPYCREPARPDGSGLGIQLVIDEVDLARVRKAVLVGETDAHRIGESRELGRSAVRAICPLAQIGLLVALEV